MVGVYTITHVASGRVYIGASVDIRHRWINHRWSLNRGDHHSRHLQRAWNKYGEAAFAFAVLTRTTRSRLRRDERRLIRERRPEFNCMRSDRPGVIRHGDESRAKMSAAQRRRWAERRENGTAHHSDATKAKMSAAATGRRHTAEARKKMAASARNRPPISDDTRMKLSAALKRRKGKRFSEAHKNALRDAHKRCRCPHHVKARKETDALRTE